MRPAEARLAASIMMNSSISRVFTGEAMGWTRKTSRARMFSMKRTKTFSLLNSNTSHWPRGFSRYSQMSHASAAWALPVKTFSSWESGVSINDEDANEYLSWREYYSKEGALVRSRPSPAPAGESGDGRLHLGCTAPQ